MKKKHKKPELSQSLILDMLDVHNNAETISEEEYKQFILENFDCEYLEDEFIQKNKCPECFDRLEVKSRISGMSEAWGQIEELNETFLECQGCNNTY